MKKTIWCLIKFFEKEEYADQFLAGKLYLNRLSYFKNQEEKEDVDDDGRPDRHEAVAMWWQPKDLIIKLDVAGFGSFTIPPEDLAAPVVTSYNYHDYLHVLCLYAVHSGEFDCVKGNIQLQSEDELAKLKEWLQIDKRVFNFGKYAVVTKYREFFSHVSKTLKAKNYHAVGKLVEYYDEEVFNGHFEEADIPFRKQKRFAFQREYRVCVSDESMGETPMHLDVGDMSAFSQKVLASNLPELVGFNPTKFKPE